MNRVLPVLLASCSIVALGAPAAVDVQFGQAVPASLNPGPNVESSLLVELRLGNRALSSAFPAILVQGGKICLPFRALCDALQVPAAVDLTALRAAGHLSQPHGAFHLDVRARRAQANATVIVFEPWRALAFEGDLYVDAHLLEAWLPLRFHFDYSRLELRAASLAKLPVELAWERETRRSHLNRDATAFAQPAPVRQDRPRFVSMPFLDLTLSSEYEDGRPRAGSGPFERLQISGAGDLLHMNARWFAAGPWNDPFDLFRIQFDRYDPGGGLLGSLKAKRVALGDLWIAASPLVAKSRLGRGFEISSFPSNRLADTTRTDLAGDAMPGWEVELYRNEQLIDFQVAGPDGTYRFSNVPLVFGTNEFLIVSYGPNGEVREERRPFFIGQGLGEPGKTNYRLAAIQQDDDLFAHRSIGDGRDRGKLRWIAELEHGLTPTSALTATAARIPFQGEERTYTALGVRKSLGRAFGVVEGIRDDRGGWGIAASLQTRVKSSNLSLEVGKFGGGFVSEAVGKAQRPLSFLAKARLDGSYSAIPGIPLAYSVALAHELDYDGRADTVLTGRFATNLGGIIYSNSLRFGRRLDQPESANGVFGVKRRVGGLWYRAELGYSFSSPALETASLAADWIQSKSLRLQAGIRQELDSKRTVVFAGLNRRTQSGSLGLNLEYGSEGGVRGGLMLSMGLGSDPKTGKWRTSSESQATAGHVSARVYRDRNGSGTFDEGDEPLSGVAFRAGRRKLEGRSGADGRVLLSGLPVGEPVEITVDSASLEDSTLAPVCDPIAVLPRAGVALALDFPMTPVADVEGTLSVERDGRGLPLAGVEVQLWKEGGACVARAIAAYDGVYLFEGVRPGRYSLRMNPESLAKFELSEIESIEVEVKPDGETVQLPDITLTAVLETRTVTPVANSTEPKSSGPRDP